MNFFFLFSFVWRKCVKEQNRNFFLTLFSSFWSRRREKQKREQKKDRREQNFTLWVKKRAKFDFPRCAQERERILPKTSKKRRESKQKNTKDLHHLKSRTTSFVVFVALWILLLLLLSNTLLIEERLERERVFTTRVIDIAFFKVAETIKCISSLL